MCVFQWICFHWFSVWSPSNCNSSPLSTVNYCAWMAFSPLAVPPMIRTRMPEVLTNTKQNLIWVHKVIKTEARDDEKLKLSSSVLTAFSCWPSNTRKNHEVDACNDHLSFYMHWCAPHLDVYIFCSIVDLILKLFLLIFHFQDYWPTILLTSFNLSVVPFLPDTCLTSPQSIRYWLLRI